MLFKCRHQKFTKTYDKGSDSTLLNDGSLLKLCRATCEYKAQEQNSSQDTCFQTETQDAKKQTGLY